MTTSGGSDAQRQIIDRAMRDPAFRARLLENPAAAIEEELGTSISSSATIRVIEQQPDEVVLVLPASSTPLGTTVSDEELDRVAGGAGLTSAGLGACG